MTSIVVAAGSAGSRALVRAADSAARQTVPCDIVLAISGAGPPSGIVRSIVSRLGAAEARAETDPAALNAAVRRARGESVVLLPAPWRLEPHMAARCVRALDERPDAAVVVPAFRLKSVTGRLLRTVTVQPSLAELLANPFSSPPVFALRRAAWEAVGPFDEAAGPLAPCDWWLRLFGSRLAVAVLDEPLATLAAGERDWWPAPAGGALDVARYRAVLEKHRALLESDAAALVVELEMAFARLLAEHRDELPRRDEDLAELERLRAEAAHHRAYLDHHGRGAIEWGDLRRVDPVSRDWGYDRGTPVDRRYIEAFLAAHSSDVSGAVLEIQEDDFTRRFGGLRVASSAVVDLDDSNPRATIVTDLRAAAGLDDALFDCIILTQTLHVIGDMAAVLGECFRILKPGGVLLATLPSASRVCLEYGEDGDLWRCTPAGARALFEPVFGPENVEVTPSGNVLTNVAFLHGLGCAELTDGEFEATDPYHPLLAGVRARKDAGLSRPLSPRRHQGLVLLYHRVTDEASVHELGVPATVLEEQLQWLASECRVMPLDEMLATARDGLPERAVAVTFDDGYLDVLECAVPLLERLGLPATVFATSRWLNEHGEYWWDSLERALLAGTPPPQLTIDVDGVPVTFPTATQDDRRAAHDLLYSRLVHASLEHRDRVLSQIVRWSGHTPDPNRRPMLADELRSLARTPGISVGAHSVNHLSLPDQPAAIQRREVLDSMRALEVVLGRRVETFAFPYGAIDSATADLARAVCRWSASCAPGAISGSFDAARVPRLEVKRWDAAALAEQMGRKEEGRRKKEEG